MSDYLAKHRRQHPSEVKDLPKEEHYQILVNESMAYDDGYGSHGQSSMSTMHYMTIVVCENQEQVVEWVRENDNRRSYVVQLVKPVRVTTQIKISLED